ncbi:peroxide stress protein YaaA [Kiloniella sp. b19]|uniref:peroxide stress protein YaaA n=1 Tax=Kiloniella sp. GXU_MW_B19 TaxID=3141326 RepID=UPI0031D28294
MLVVVSPAKKLDESLKTRGLPVTQPDFIPETQELLEVAQELTRPDLKRLMGISDALAELNYERYRAFDFPFAEHNASAAAFMFRGDTYTGLDADSLSDEELLYAQGHLRILSGLYGILRPLDLMQPYRLEMGTRLSNPVGEDLYDYWGTRLADHLSADLEGHAAQVVINCASNEYFKAANEKAIRGTVITPVFKEEKDGIAKIVSFSAKRARGMMARYIIQNRIEQPEDIRAFTEGGYKFQPEQSDQTTYIFTRPKA